MSSYLEGKYMILIDAVGVLMYSTKTEKLIKDYLISLDFEEIFVEEVLKSMHKYDFGDCFTTKEWFSSFKQELDFYNNILSEIIDKIDPSKQKIIFQSLYSFLPFNQRILYDDTKLYLEKLSKLDKVVLVSNAHASMFQLLEKFDIKRYFYKIYLSCDLACAKPSRIFFEKVLSDLGVKAKSCFYIDDCKQNIIEASKLEINSILIDRKTDSAEIKNLKDFYEKIRTEY